MTTDTLTNSLGKPGKFQVLLYIYISTSWIYICWNHVGMVFIGAETKHHCAVANSTDVSKLVPKTTRNGNSDWDGCNLYDGYNTSKKIPCTHGWTYYLPEREATIISEWDLVCGDAYKTNLATTIYFVGVMVGSLVFGTLSDKFGRRPVFLFTAFTPFVLGMFLFFMKNYIAFVVLRFFLGFILQGLQMVTFTMLIEIFPTKYRTLSGLAFGFPWAIGIMSFALFSYLIKDWHYIQLMSTSVCLFQIGLVWWLPESIRWLLISKRFDQAEKIVRKISTFNKISFPKEIFDKTVAEIETTVKDTNDIKSYTIADLFRIRVLRKRSFILMVIWFSASLGYYGLTLNVSTLAGNKYLNFFISGAMEIVITIAIMYILNRFGRRKPLFLSCLVAGVALIIAGVLPKSNKNVETMVTVLAIGGRMLITGIFSNVNICSTELYPTTMRNVGLGAGFLSARIGGIVAPQILLLGIVTAEAIPFVVLGGMLLLSGVLALLLQETLNVELPETIEEAGKMSKKQLETTHHEPVNSDKVELTSWSLQKSQPSPQKA